MLRLSSYTIAHISEYGGNHGVAIMSQVCKTFRNDQECVNWPQPVQQMVRGRARSMLTDTIPLQWPAGLQSITLGSRTISYIKK
jgi:hypothetical protein